MYPWGQRDKTKGKQQKVSKEDLKTSEKLNSII